MEKGKLCGHWDGDSKGRLSLIVLVENRATEGIVRGPDRRRHHWRIRRWLSQLGSLSSLANFGGPGL